MDQNRSIALRALTSSLMTGEVSASRRLGAALADDATLVYGTEEHTGRDAVLTRLSGEWAATFALRHLVWSDPVEDGARVSLEGVIHGQAAWAPRGARLEVDFDADQRIAAVTVAMINERPGAPETVIPASARGVINNARISNHPMCIAYVNAQGAPVQTFRGSLQVFSDTQLSVWLRKPQGELASAIAVNPAVSITYQDSPGSHLFITGTASVAADDAVIREVYAAIPEVEALHDPAMTGTAMIIDVSAIRGWLDDQWIMMQR